MIHCCVVGGSGFVGSHLVEILLKNGRKVTVIGRNSEPTYSFSKEITYISGDYGDKYFLEGVLGEVDEIVDLAYYTTPQTSFDDPTQDILKNLPSAVNLFQIASSLNLKKFILVSSGGTVYGRANYIPIREDHPTNPISPYGITKLAIEKYALMYHQLFDLPVVCIRPSNAFGERQKAFTGQGFIATALLSILNNKEITIFGTEGTVRDYLHVEDVASGIAAALDFGDEGSCYNLGSGVGKSNMDVLDAIRFHAEPAGFKIKIKFSPERPFDVPVNILDCKKIKEVSGWESSISFEDAIAKYWKWLLSKYSSKRENIVP